MDGWSASPFSHWTAVDQDGGFGEEVMEDQTGVPEREMEVTVQERAVADLQMREPGGRELASDICFRERRE